MKRLAVHIYDYSKKFTYNGLMYWVPASCGTPIAKSTGGQDRKSPKVTCLKCLKIKSN